MNEKDKYIKWLYPNNKPTITTEERMAERGMALEYVGPNGFFGYREAGFVDIFGRREMHLLPNILQ